MKHIIVSVTNDLVTDQRVHKVCSSLTKSGYKVLLIGRFFKKNKPLNRIYETKRMRLYFNTGFLFYAEYNLRLFLKLLFIKKHVLIANDLDTLLPNFIISKLFKTKLVYDSHELFTEVPELIDRPKTQKIWLTIEKKIVPKLSNCITVCRSIANYYDVKYNTAFHIIKNVPQYTTPKPANFPFDKKNNKIILYQGALNKGRGIEHMIDAMKYLKGYIFVIAGAGDIEKNLKQQVLQNGIENKIHFLGRLEPNRLKSITPLADLGISFEEDLGLNYRFALPNKLFDYIHAKIPSLVSDLPEMKKIIINNAFGAILKSNKPEEIAAQITAIFNDPLTYNKWKENLNKPNDFQWKIEETKLKSIFNNLQ